jgi:hypothetical protein
MIMKNAPVAKHSSQELTQQALSNIQGITSKRPDGWRKNWFRVLIEIETYAKKNARRVNSPSVHGFA